MKVKFLALSICALSTTALPVFAQVNCTNSEKLVCEVPSNAAIVAESALGKAGLATAQGLAGAINSSIGTQLSQLPIPSASVGVSTVKDASGALVPFNNLGPILGDRPDTVGRHHTFIGFSYQHFNFNAIDGINLKNLVVGYQANTTITNTTPTGTTTAQAIVYGSENTSVNFTFDQYIAAASYGLTRTADITVAIPFNHVSLSSVTTNPQAYLYNETAQTWSQAGPPNPQTVSYRSSGSSSGVGDTIISFKQMLMRGDSPKAVAAIGVDVRFPTGDAENYLGSGAYGYNVHGLFEYRSRISPRFKIGYQWNGASQLVDIFAYPTKNLPGGFQYDAGIDYSIRPGLTIAGDLLGSQFLNSLSLTATTINLGQNAVTKPPPNTVPPAVAAHFPILNSAPSTYTTGDFSAGIKWLIRGRVLFYGNVLIPMNNVGLRSEPVPICGMAYVFH